MKKISLFLVFLLISVVGFSQTVVIGATTGTTNSYFYGPLYRSSAGSTFNWSNYAALYTAAELTIPGGSLITNIDWLKYSAGEVTGSNNVFEVWLENTAATTMTDATWGTLKGTATLVYSSATQNVTGAAGTWFGVAPSTFIYTGGNLKVLTRWVKNGTATAAVPFYTNTATGFSIGIASGSVTTDATTLAAATGYGNIRPTVRFTYTGASPCSGTPAPGNTISSTPSACSGAPFSLSLQNSTSGTGVSYQWQSAPTSAFATPTTLSSTGPSQSIAGQTTATWYRCIVTCGANSGTSTPVQVTMNSFLNCYCASSATSAADEDISNVTIGTLNNSSTCTTLAPGPGSVVSMYSNYKSGPGAPAPILAQQGDIVPFSLTMTTCGGNYGNSFDVYIDYNQNGSFADPGELVYDGASFTGTHTDVGSFTIPFTSTLGTTAVRVINVEGLATSPCQSYSWGETEDYLITISASVACSGATPGNTLTSASAVCVAQPFTLSLQNNTTGSGVSYVWQSAPTSAFATITTLSSTGPSQTIASQSSTTWYRCIVTCSTGPTTGISTPVQVTQNAPTACYCTPVTSQGCTDGDVIAQVILNTLNNNSGTGCPSGLAGYSDYTGNPLLTTTLVAGNTYGCQVWAGQWAESYAAWIDFNNNGVFDHPAERIGFTSTPVAGSGSVGVLGGSATFPVVISCNPAAGTYRLRVRAMYAIAGSAMTPCGANTYGETEDYLITIDPPLPCPAPSAFAAAPTPGGANLTWTAGCVETQWAVHVTTVGGGAPTGTASNPGLTTASLSLTGQDPNTQYEAWVRANCEPSAPGNGQSTWVGPLLYTTGATCFPPTALVVSNITATNAEVNFTAPASGSPAGYRYFVSTSATAPPFATAGTVITGPGATQTTLGNTLTPNTLHYVWVRSNCGNMPVSGNPNNSDWSVSTSFTTLNVPCSGTPAPGNTIAGNLVCAAGGTVNLSLQNPTTGAGVTYQWQESADAAFTTPVALGTAATQVGTVNATTWFRCIVTCSSGPASGTSTPVMVVISGTPTVGNTFGAPIVIGQAPCSATPYTSTINSANCYTNDLVGSQAAPDVFYQFTLAAPATIEAGLCGTTFDTYMHLLDNTGAILQSNDDNGPLCTGLQSSISTALAAGTYYIVTEGFSSNVGNLVFTLKTTDPCTATMNLTVFVEGYYIPASSPAAMNPVMYNNFLFGGPTANPTDVVPVTVELWPNAGGAAHTATGILADNGSLSVTLPAAAIGNAYWISLSTSNTLRTFSASSVTIASTNTYNFSNAMTQAATDGSGDPMATLAPGLFGLRSGDISQDEFIDGTDYSIFESEVPLTLINFNMASDLNGDGFVDGTDYPILDVNSAAGYYAQYPSFL